MAHGSLHSQSQPTQLECVDMRNIEEGNLKDLGLVQKCLFDYAECLEIKTEVKNGGMPSWFWKLARECREDVSG